MTTADNADSIPNEGTHGRRSAGNAPTDVEGPLEAEAVEAILNRSEDAPHNVQALSSVAWEILAAEGGDALTPKVVARAKLLVERDGPFYLTVWNGLTTIQQRVLTADHGYLQSYPQGIF